MPTPLKIPSFTPLSPCTSIYIPPSSSLTKPTRQTINPPPPLILLCAYLNASAAHINKYASFYKRLFPTSRILLVTTSSSHFLFQSSKSWDADLDPAVTALLSLSGHSQDQVRNQSPDEQLGTEKGSQKVLLHVISTGGATAATKIAEAYMARSGRRLPIAKMILDSCPGVQGWGSTVGAFSIGLAASGQDGSVPWSWSWIWGRVKTPMVGVALRVFFAAWFLGEFTMGIENVVGVVRGKLNVKALFRDDAARLYIYGGKDELVRAQDVEDHADEAERGGYEVLRVRYGDSGHAGHLLQDESRFRASVMHLWDSGILSGPGMVICAW
ncbi:uncharacterized protein KD926_003931 [Aspergillus affinis]|uniref:uncharacterized protein n=1 Tax=Aspergillus affinis TaxID=1070780 RepID=UPI0022FE8A32|nr:uncharacterized protein KD926_003931 [Aspergillus affinis]KAI9046093.1 hypothetical protein KD926_003931 [Aspergillus affinis]